MLQIYICIIGTEIERIFSRCGNSKVIIHTREREKRCPLVNTRWKNKQGMRGSNRRAVGHLPVPIYFSQ